MLKRIGATLGAATVAGLIAVAPAAAAPQAISVTASVSGQVCQGGDFAKVTLQATAQSEAQPVVFRWDFTNNGSFDTPATTRDTVIHGYPDEVNVTARVIAVNSAGERATDTVSFATLRCP
jgi:hypothetical protein